MNFPTINGISFPEPSLISNKRVREAYERLQRQHGIELEAGRRIAQAIEQRQAASAAALRAFQEALDGAEDANNAFRAAEQTPAAKPAEQLYAEAEAMRQAAAAAAYDASLRVVAAVDANAEPWRKNLLRDTQVTLDRLANIHRALEKAQQDLSVDLGFLEMLEARRTGSDDGRLNLNRAQKITSWLSEADAGLREGIGRLSLRLGELRDAPATVAAAAEEPITITVD